MAVDSCSTVQAKATTGRWIFESGRLPACARRCSSTRTAGPCPDAACAVAWPSGSRDRWPGCMRAGRDQQPVEFQVTALGQRHRLAARIDCRHLIVHQIDAERFIVILTVAQMRAVLFDVVGQQIRQRHARIGRFRLIADQRDRTLGVSPPQRFSGNDAGWTRTDDNVFHAASSPPDRQGRDVSASASSARRPVSSHDTRNIPAA